MPGKQNTPKAVATCRMLIGCVYSYIHVLTSFFPIQIQTDQIEKKPVGENMECMNILLYSLNTPQMGAT